MFLEQNFISVVMFPESKPIFFQSDLLLYLCLTVVKYICLLVQLCSHPICIPQLLQNAMPPSSAFSNEGWRYPLLPLILLRFKWLCKSKHQKNSPNILSSFGESESLLKIICLKGFSHQSTAFSLIRVPLLWTLIREMLKAWNFC